jgi:hypothetical protein
MNSGRDKTREKWSDMNETQAGHGKTRGGKTGRTMNLMVRFGKTSIGK